MSETPSAPRLAATFAEVEDALLSRWPETRLEPSLDRIRAFTELLGDPQESFQVIHLTGTNGKTSTARFTDSLVRGLGLRTGRFTSPHVERMTERQQEHRHGVRERGRHAGERVFCARPVLHREGTGGIAALHARPAVRDAHADGERHLYSDGCGQ